MHGNVLLLSQRRISTLVAFCFGYEFEDTVEVVFDTFGLPYTEKMRNALDCSMMSLRGHRQRNHRIA
jgi:hypothetical protein